MNGEWLLQLTPGGRFIAALVLSVPAGLEHGSSLAQTATLWSGQVPVGDAITAVGAAQVVQLADVSLLAVVVDSPPVAGEASGHDVSFWSQIFLKNRAIVIVFQIDKR